MKQFINSTLVLLVFLLVSKVHSAQPLDWQFHNIRHSIVDRILSPQAQDGGSLAVVDTSQLDFQENYSATYDFRPRGFSRYDYSDSQPWGFLYQTFSAKEYRNKHLHISAFAKSLEPDFKALEDWYAEQYSLLIETELANLDAEVSATDNSQPQKTLFTQGLQGRQKQALLDFTKFIRDSYEAANFEIWVVLYRTSKIEGETIIEGYTPTSSGRNNSAKLWNRFNIEVGIPEDCYAISVVFESQGLNRLYFDHVALVEHGEKLAEARAGSLSMSHPFVEHIKTNFKIDNTGYQNLSFER